MNTKRHLMSGLLLVLPVTTPAIAANVGPYPYLKPDNSWISVSGKVTSTQPDAFTLNYGDDSLSRNIRVEMDDWDWYQEGRLLEDGQKVRVHGRIHDDLYETRTIEAGSVYVEDLGTYFYASSVDEEDYDYWIDYTPVVIGGTHVRGTVTKVDGREFTINTGLRELIVDTDEMLYNPMDDKGYQRVDKGDLLSVAGQMDYDFWEHRELKADRIVILEDDDHRESKVRPTSRSEKKMSKSDSRR